MRAYLFHKSQITMKEINGLTKVLVVAKRERFFVRAPFALLDERLLKLTANVWDRWKNFEHQFSLTEIWGTYLSISQSVPQPRADPRSYRVVLFEPILQRFLRFRQFLLNVLHSSENFREIIGMLTYFYINMVSRYPSNIVTGMSWNSEIQFMPYLCIRTTAWACSTRSWGIPSPRSLSSVLLWMPA